MLHPTLVASALSKYRHTHTYTYRHFTYMYMYMYVYVYVYVYVYKWYKIHTTYKASVFLTKSPLSKPHTLPPSCRMGTEMGVQTLPLSCWASLSLKTHWAFLSGQHIAKCRAALHGSLQVQPPIAALTPVRDWCAKAVGAWRKQYFYCLILACWQTARAPLSHHGHPVQSRAVVLDPLLTITACCQSKTEPSSI